MPSAFRIASAISQSPDGTFAANIPAGWDQGHAAFGGLVLGLLARAMEAALPDKARTLRTIIGDICGPVLPGPAKLTVRTLRRGNNQSNLQVELVQNGEVLALGSGVFATARKAVMPKFSIETPPPPPDWNSVPITAIRPPQGPPFGQHLEFRVIKGVPFSGAPDPLVEGFVRLQGQDGPLDAADLIALLDAHWPGTLSMATPSAPHANATVSFAGQLFADSDAIDWRVPLYYRSRIAAHHKGYFLELRELWQGSTCVALNQQTLALIR